MMICQQIQTRFFVFISRMLSRRLADFFRIVRMVAFNTCQIHVGIPYDLVHAMRHADGPRLLADLRRGMDSESMDLLDMLQARIQFFSCGADGYTFLIYTDAMLSKRERADIVRWRDVYAECRRRYHFPGHLFTTEAFLYHHGLVYLPSTCHAFIVGKDFIDLGAFIGDSTLVLQVYRPRKVYAFDVSPANSRRFWHTMRRNGIDRTKVELVTAGVSDGQEHICINDTGAKDTALDRIGNTEVNVTTVDAFVMQRSINVGLIKMDIEGMGLRAIRGMEMTLRTHRPVLLLAIYHNADEFFLIKPFIESLGINYKFMLRKLIPSALYMETTLLAYPAEYDLEENNSRLGSSS